MAAKNSSEFLLQMNNTLQQMQAMQQEMFHMQKFFKADERCKYQEIQRLERVNDEMEVQNAQQQQKIYQLTKEIEDFKMLVKAEKQKIWMMNEELKLKNEQLEKKKEQLEQLEKIVGTDWNLQTLHAEIDADLDDQELEKEMEPIEARFAGDPETDSLLRDPWLDGWQDLDPSI